MQKLHNPTIAIIDSGIGGVSILKALIKKYNAGNYIYFSDNLYMPYGNKSFEFLKKRLNDIITMLRQEYKADIVIVACNTASCVLKDNKDPYIVKMKFDSNGTYLATPATKKLLNTKNVIADNTLAKRIEKHLFNTKKMKKDIQAMINKDNLSKLKKLVLGCTHYELVENIFKELCPNTNIICNSYYLLDSLDLDIDCSLSIFTIQSKQSKSYRDKVIKLIDN
ncbi:MAG: hypothetical protein IKM43_03200 [Clostridia bacterium]|nr:hypothetical protein [Clostridia bacterium]